MGRCKGSRQTEVTKERIRQSLKGRKRGEEFCLKISLAQKGKVISIEQRERIRKTLSIFYKGKSFGINLLPEEKRKEIYKKIGKKLSITNKGRKLSEEAKMKIGKASRGRKHSEEVKRKIGLLGKGIKRSKEFKEKISRFHTGKVVSEETRKKLSLIGMGHRVSNETREKLRVASTNPSEEVREKIRRARIRQIIPKKDTSIEIRLQKFLDWEGIPFEKHKPIFGQPDIFIKPNICVFADGDYWHRLLKSEERDKKVNERLKEEGYKVLRFWEKDIRKDINSCIKQIEETLFLNYIGG